MISLQSLWSKNLEKSRKCQSRVDQNNEPFVIENNHRSAVFKVPMEKATTINCTLQKCDLQTMGGHKFAKLTQVLQPQKYEKGLYLT